MSDFEKLTQLYEDFTATWAAFDAARHDAADMIDAATKRLQMERTQNAARAAELQRTATDPNRSETVRRVAASELSRIRDRRYSATPEETAAFAELVKQQKCALRDLKQIQQDTKAAIEGASKSIQEIRGKILGNQLVDAAPSWIPGQEAEFAKLCKEAGYND